MSIGFAQAVRAQGDLWRLAVTGQAHLYSRVEMRERGGADSDDAALMRLYAKFYSVHAEPGRVTLARS